MFATNGYRTFAMTRSNKIAAARKAIAAYQAHVDRGVSDAHAAALALFIQGQEEVIKEWKEMAFHPGEW